MRAFAAALAAMTAAGASSAQEMPCALGCADEPGIEFTLRGGGRDSLRLSGFTSRLALEADSIGHELSLSAGALDIGGGLLDTDPSRAGFEGMNFGAAYDIGSFTVGGGLSMDIPDATGGAGFGVDWRATDSVTFGGSLSVSEGLEAQGQAAPDVAGGVSIRLSF